MRHLLWVFTVCQCPFYGTQGINGLIAADKGSEALIFFLFLNCYLLFPCPPQPGGRGFNPSRGRQHSFVEIDHEIFSTVILSLPLIQEGQLSVSGERVCTILVNRLED